MLVSQHNGIGLGADAEVDVLQNLACSIGPRVDGAPAGVATPQAMGAFSTFAAQAACAGRDQQQEQHQPTTTATRELGASAFPTMTTSQTILQKAIALRQETGATMKPAAAQMTAEPVPPVTPSAAAPAPLGPSVTTYPAGSITAFDAKTNMWRVAVPAGSLGLGIFGATASFTEVAPTQSPPAGATQVSPTQFQKQTGTLPIYKQWWFWGAIGGAAIGVGGTLVLLRRRKRAA